MFRFLMCPDGSFPLGDVLKGVIVVLGIVDQPVAGIQDPLFVAVAAVKINIAFVMEVF